MLDMEKPKYMLEVLNAILCVLDPVHKKQVGNVDRLPVHHRTNTFRHLQFRVPTPPDLHVCLQMKSVSLEEAQPAQKEGFFSVLVTSINLT